ncbi:MAG: ATP-binding cassette domain-containing protein [Oscillospiraceae bacterium]|nr:ATP-binding cassette domain-containing protein [Oscillospiraceae bacterium]
MIEINGLTKKYGDKVVVNNITFDVSAGEVVGFLGPNGAGKSTTMNILTGYISSTFGTARIDGIDILENPMEAKRKIGFLPEQPPLYLEMTVKEYLNFVYDLKGTTLNRKKHISEICEVVKITDVYNRTLKNLSKGYRQRVGIAQALVGNPPVLIFDEPTVGLDPKQIIDIRNLIKALGKDHTIILSTHILPEVQAVCDRIIILNRGSIIANEKTEEISKLTVGPRRLVAKIAGPQNEVLKMLKTGQGIVFVDVLAERDGDAVSYMIESQPSIDIRKPLFYALADRGWPLIGLEAMGLNLEDIFISLVANDRGTKNKLNPGKSKKVAGQTIHEASARDISSSDADSGVNADKASASEKDETKSASGTEENK